MSDSPYVIVRPGGWAHVSDNPHAHLVVRVDEWVRVLHQEQKTYNFVVEHPSYDLAHNQRNELNGTGDRLPEPPPDPVEQVENPVEVTGEVDVKWLGASLQ